MLTACSAVVDQGLLLTVTLDITSTRTADSITSSRCLRTVADVPIVVERASEVGLCEGDRVRRVGARARMTTRNEAQDLTLQSHELLDLFQHSLCCWLEQV
jgi:hypothetical protein